MLPNEFDFAMLPSGSASYTLNEVGMLQSTIEDIDLAMYDYLQDLQLMTFANEGPINPNILWQSPERSFQIKHKKELRDNSGALKLPLLSIERTGIAKDPNRKGGFQAHIYSKNKNGRS